MTADVRSLLDHPGLRRVLELLNGDGEEARVVGGAVRNTLLGHKIGDFDITTTALPETVVQRAAAARLRTVPTGIEHGTVTLVLHGRPYEVTTLREDIETDGRRAKIRFGRDFAVDALRRDFTINALSVDLEGRVHDYAGGLDDIAARRVRFIGDPTTRIREDYLRILRFFRFSAYYAGGDFNEAGIEASIRERGGLVRLSRERVRQELLKSLVGPRAATAIGIMAEAGLIEPLLRSVPQPARLSHLIAIESNADPILRLAALSVLVAEDAARLQDALRLSNSEAKRLEAAAEALEALHGARSPPPSLLLRRLLFAHGRAGACDGLRLVWAESGVAAGDAGWASALRFLEETPEPRLPFSGADLIAHGVPSGKGVGAALKQLQADWIRAGFPQDPRRLAELLSSVTPK